MNTDFRLSAGYFEHPKIQKVSRKLGDSGVLSHIRLLRFVAVNRPDGDLSGMDTLEVALAGGYTGDEDAFVACLLDARLLDRGEDGTLRVHDWVDHNEYAATAPQRKSKASTAAKARWGSTDTPPQSSGSNPPSAGSTGSGSNRSGSNGVSGRRKAPAPPVPAEAPILADSSNCPADAPLCSEHDLALLSSDLALLSSDLALLNSQNSNAPTSLPTYEASLQASEANPTTTTSLPSAPPGDTSASSFSGTEAVDPEVVVASLRDLGVSESIAPMLVQRKGAAAVQKQIEWLPSRIRDRLGTKTEVRDPAALLVRAIEDGYAVPASFSQARQHGAEEQDRSRRSAEKERQAKEREDAERQVKEAGQAKLQAAWEALPPEKQQEVTEEVTGRFRQQFSVHVRALDKAGDPQRMPAGPRRQWEQLRDAVLLERSPLAG